MMGWERITSDAITSAARRSAVKSFIEDLEKSFDTETGESLDRSIKKILESNLKKAKRRKKISDQLWLITLFNVLSDLSGQRWRIRYERSHLFAKRPIENNSRDALRERLIVRRNQQLTKDSVRKFINKMEGWKITDGRRSSILSLMCDGRKLEKRLVDSNKGVIDPDSVIKPYIQVVSQDTYCEHTGLKLSDIWRYFRHTWSAPSENIPGRSMQLLVRDASWTNHPVIGIAALSSATMRLTARDIFIGWDTDHFIKTISEHPTASHSSWVQDTIQKAIQEIYIDDFVRDKVVSADPVTSLSDKTLEELIKISYTQKDIHHRLMETGDFSARKNTHKYNDEDWESQAQTPLFRSKRAAELANLLKLWRDVERAYLGKSGESKIKALTATANGRDILSKVVKVARSKTVGTEIADLTVCGAIAPYNHLTGGKLVAMLAVSPEAVDAYKRRYSKSCSIIASSMAGRRINRKANLVFVGTSSLYGKRPNQYDRISFPIEHRKGDPSESIKYHFIRDKNKESAGKSTTKGIGTFHFSPDTLRSLEEYTSVERGGWKINNVFGEGTSPKMRAIRAGVSVLGLNPNKVLVHGIEKSLYGVPLIRNLSNYLLGIDADPDYFFDNNASADQTKNISNWWFRRWGIKRSKRADVLDSIKRENLIYPIRHHARISLPEDMHSQIDLFGS